jgi:hypothetical protein
MKPEHTGARLGPAIGASVKMDIAAPRSRPLHISPIILPLLVSGEEAIAPPSRRKIRIDAVFRDSAQPIWNPT